MVSAPRLIPILSGPTASGKTALALSLARRAGNVEIVNADSLLVYRGMNIGTAKPSHQELEETRHHLIDIREPSEDFTAGDFIRESDRIIEDISARRKMPFFVGGSGFYLKARLYGLWQAPPTDENLRSRLEASSNTDLYEKLYLADPESALRIGVNDRYRLVRALEIIELSGSTPSELRSQGPKLPDPRFALWVVDRPTREIENRIDQRTHGMLREGLVEETKQLLAKFPRARALNAVGYAQTVDYLEGKPPEGRKVLPGLPGLSAEISLATRQLVKRQRTWFRGEKSSEWFMLEADQEKLEVKFLEIHQTWQKNH
jgi:tRNA dimethylallyltransferase